VAISRAGDNLASDTGSARHELIPEEGDGVALEDDEEEVVDAEEDVEHHDGADDPDVGFLDGDAVQKDSDGELDECAADVVVDFTPPPELK
jgi:hypothetical protein